MAAPPKHNPMMRERHLVTLLKRNSCSASRSPFASSACSSHRTGPQRGTCGCAQGNVHCCPWSLKPSSNLSRSGMAWPFTPDVGRADNFMLAVPFMSPETMSTPSAANTSRTASRKFATKFLRLAQLLLTCTLIMVNRALPSVRHLIEQALATTHESAH